MHDSGTRCSRCVRALSLTVPTPKKTRHRTLLWELPFRCTATVNRFHEVEVEQEMCGRYTLRVTRDELADRFDAPVRADFEPTYNAAPGQHLPVVRSDGDDAEEGEADEDEYVGDRAVDLLLWGFIPSWADDADGHINARAETVAEKPSFSDAYERRRCLVPADGFYEWTDEGPWYVDFDGVVALAGIWECHVPETRQAGLSDYADTDDENGETRREVETFAVLTTEPSQQVARLHHRMAAVLTRGDEQGWLDGTVGADELGPRELNVDVRRVSERVNNPSNDDESLVEEV